MVGWGYERQQTADLCVSELRPAASDECCHLGDDGGSIGLRIHQSRAFLYLEAYKDNTFPWSGVVRKFYRSTPTFQLEEVTGATDHTGNAVDAETVRAFLQNVQDAGRYQKGFACSYLKDADPP